MPSTKTIEQIRIDPEVKQAIIARMGAQESYNDVLRRLLALDDAREREQVPAQ